MVSGNFFSAEATGAVRKNPHGACIFYRSYLPFGGFVPLTVEPRALMLEVVT